MPPTEQCPFPGQDDPEKAGGGAQRLPGELDVAVRVLRNLLDCQMETVREVESIVSGLLGAPWDEATGRGMTPVEELAEVLTCQEAKVLEQICLARTNRQIAKMLGITEKTAKNYVQAVFRKLGVHSRTEAVMVAIRNRWFEFDVEQPGPHIPRSRHEVLHPSARRPAEGKPGLRSAGDR